MTRPLARALGATTLSAASVVSSVLRVAVRGSLPSWLIARLLRRRFSRSSCSPFARASRSAPWNGSRPLVRRHGFWVLAIATVVPDSPALGASGLVDRVERHYAEVARETTE